MDQVLKNYLIWCPWTHSTITPLAIGINFIVYYHILEPILSRTVWFQRNFIPNGNPQQSLHVRGRNERWKRTVLDEIVPRFCNGVSSKLLSVIPADYVKEMRPPVPQGQPVIVDFGIYVYGVTSINVDDMDFRMDMYIRQTWTDSRLQFPEDRFEEGDEHVTLSPAIFAKLWQPDPYFLNSKVTEIAKFTHKFTTVNLYRNRTIRYSARMHAIIACQMEFQLYPMDIQACPIKIESFSYIDRKLRFRWSEDGVTLNNDLKLLQYNIGQPLHLEESKQYINDKDGNYSRLVVYLRFEREIGHHLIQTFAPSSLVVMLSWFSFWLDLDAVPGRISLLVTSMLTLVTMFTGLRASIPPVAYIKALDIWMAGCMLFVFAALGEFVVVKVLDKQYQLKKLKAQESVHRTNALGAWLNADISQERILWKEIDKLSRVVFPVVFLIFLTLYWPILIIKNKTYL